MCPIICRFDYLGVPDGVCQTFISLFCCHKHGAATRTYHGGGSGGAEAEGGRVAVDGGEVVSLYSIRPWCVTLRVIVRLDRFGGRSVSRRKHMALVFSNIVHRCTNVFSAYLSSAKRPFITTARLLSVCKTHHPFFFCSSHKQLFVSIRPT